MMQLNVTPAIYDSIYTRKKENNILDELEARVIADDLVWSLKCNGFLTRDDLDRYRDFLRARMPWARTCSSNATLLDVGCGTGRFGWWLSRELGAQLIGIDFSSVAVSHAVRYCRLFPDNRRALFAVGDFSHPGLADKSITAAVSLDALYLYTDPKLALSELHRVVVNEGLLIFTYYSAERPSETMAKIYETKWPSLVSETGFQVVDFKDITFQWRSHMRKKHEIRWRERQRILSELGPMGDAELKVTASMLGIGQASFIDAMERFEVVAVRR